MDSLRELLQRSTELSGLPSDNLPVQTQEEREQAKCDFYNASEGDLHFVDGYSCAKCKNKGYIAVVTFNEMYGYYAETLTRCKCMKVRSAIRKLEKSGLQNAVKACTFDRFETHDSWQDHIKKAAMRFCEDEAAHCFFIGGQSGAGKTHLCTAITVHFIRQGIAAHYMKWRDEIVRIKASVNEPDKYHALMQELKTVPVLYIDDLFKVGVNPQDGMARPTVADVNAAFEIINHRCTQPGLITIISSERTLPELLAIDEATAGRIAEKSKEGGYCINLKRDSSRNWRLRGMEGI